MPQLTNQKGVPSIDPGSLKPNAESLKEWLLLTQKDIRDGNKKNAVDRVSAMTELYVTFVTSREEVLKDPQVTSGITKAIQDVLPDLLTEQRRNPRDVKSGFAIENAFIFLKREAPLAATDTAKQLFDHSLDLARETAEEKKFVVAAFAFRKAEEYYSTIAKSADPGPFTVKLFRGSLTIAREAGNAGEPALSAEFVKIAESYNDKLPVQARDDEFFELFKKGLAAVNEAATKKKK